MLLLMLLKNPSDMDRMLTNILTDRVGRAANHQCNTNNVTLYFIEGANGIHVQSGSYTHSSYTSAQKLFHVTCYC